MEDVAAELAVAAALAGDPGRTEQPVTVTPKLVQQTIDEMNGILEHAALDTRVAWVRDLFDRIDVDSRVGEAAAVWRTGGNEIGAVSRSTVVSEWLRRAGARRLLQTRGGESATLALPRPTRESPLAGLCDAIIECRRCHQVTERWSPAQTCCTECSTMLRRERSRVSMRRLRTKIGR
jgi:hypothetical protein